MSRSRYFFSISILLLIFSLWGAPSQAVAQCPMCKAAVTSSSNDGKGAAGKGSPLAENLNKGILYLFVLPYSAILLVVFVVYRGYKKRKRQMALNLAQAEAEADLSSLAPDSGLK